jgi:hypothetical protein
MSNRCKVCNHSQKAEIDQALVAGEPLRGVAERFGMHYSSLSRHKSHISEQLNKSLALREFNELQQGQSVLQQIESLQAKALDLLTQAENAGDIRTAIQAVRESRGCIELMAKASGQLAPEKILVQVEPILNALIMVLKQEIHDSETLQRISGRLTTIDI